MGSDGRHRGLLVIGVVEPEAAEKVERAVPMRTGQVGLVQRAVGVSEPIVGAGLVVGLVQLDGQGEGVVMVGEGGVGAAGGVVYSAQALPRFELPVEAAAFVGQVEQELVVIGGPAYAIDEQTAINVVDGSVEVVSEGQWMKFGS